MTATLKQLARRTDGATAAEFAMVLPLLLLFLFGIIDAGRFLWDMNRAEKATQVGARTAAVTDPLSPGLIDEDYAGVVINGEMIQPGGAIPADALGTVLCSAGGCVCEAEPCPEQLGTPDSAIFNDVLLARMQSVMPQITAANVQVRYSTSGFGTAGSLAAVGGGGGGGGAVTESMEVSPLVTVSLIDLRFSPVTTLLLAELPLPNFATTLPAEDASGTFSN